MKKPIAVLLLLLAACAAVPPGKPPVEEPEMLSRTEFTGRVENFFEYAPLKANQPSEFRIHLTDLSDGTPVEKAEVTIMARAKAGGAEARSTAKIGRVTGIYVAEVTPTVSGDYNLEFHIKNAKLDERMPMTGFKVE